MVPNAYGAYVKILVAFFSRTMLNVFAMVHCFSLMTVQVGIISSSTSWKKSRTRYCLSKTTGRTRWPGQCSLVSYRTHCLTSSVARIAKRHPCPRQMYGPGISVDSDYGDIGGWSYATSVTPEHLNRHLAGPRELAKGLHVSKEVGNAKTLADHTVG